MIEKLKEQVKGHKSALLVTGGVGALLGLTYIYRNRSNNVAIHPLTLIDDFPPMQESQIPRNVVGM